MNTSPIQTPEGDRWSHEGNGVFLLTRVMPKSPRLRVPCDVNAVEIVARVTKDYTGTQTAEEIAAALYAFVTGEASPADPAHAVAKMEAEVDRIASISERHRTENVRLLNRIGVLLTTIIPVLNRAEEAGYLDHGPEMDTDLGAACARLRDEYLSAVSTSPAPAGQGDETDPEACTACDGTGEVEAHTTAPESDSFEYCAACGGSGKRPTAEQIIELRHAYEAASLGEREAQRELREHLASLSGPPAPGVSPQVQALVDAAAPVVEGWKKRRKHLGVGDTYAQVVLNTRVMDALASALSALATGR